MTVCEVILGIVIYILMGFFITELWELWSDPYYWNYSIWVGAFWPVTVPLIILWFVITLVAVLVELLLELIRRIFGISEID